MNPIHLIADTLIPAATHSQQKPFVPPIADQYHALAILLADREFETERVVEKPNSSRGRDCLLEDLTKAQADQDADLLAAMLTLLAALRDLDFGAGEKQAVGKCCRSES